MANGGLERAQASEGAARLEALLEAWRDLRHPRIADLIDRLTARLHEGVKPIKGKSVAARTEAMVALCKSENALDVARVLAAEWPGTWQSALPVLKAVVKLPDDPRVAARLAKEVDATRFETWTAVAFYRPLFARLNALQDVRQTPLLEAQLTRTKSYYYQRDMRALEEAAAERHRALEVKPLSKEDEALVEALEAPFAAVAATQTSTKRSGEELLAEVYARPDDLTARAVYGDWLSERNDPRGELISLQLGAPSEKSLKRQQALIKKHWKTWLGPIADWLRSPPRFEAGFPVEGHIDATTYRDVQESFRKIIDRPEWTTFRTLRLWSQIIPVADLVRAPRFANVKELLDIAPQELGALLATRAPLTRLELTWAMDLPPLARGAFGALSALKVLSMLGRDLAVFAPGVVHLERLVLQLDRTSPRDFAPLETMNVDAVELDLHGTRIVLTRDGRTGPFTKAKLCSTESVSDLIELLPLSIVELTSDGLERSEVQPGVLAQLATTAKRLPKLTRLELPFVEVAPKQHAPHVDLSLTGVALFEVEKLAPLWKILRDDFGVPFDTLDVRGGLALGDDPVGKLTTWCQNKRCVDLRLKVKGTPAEFPLHRTATSFTNATLPLGDRERFIKGLDALITFAKPTWLRLGGSLVLEGDAIQVRREALHEFIRKA
ncbi:MAG: TIGR02996 domain-containing protein [Myxococcaceae bacterium]